jgi:hypothetical protein
VKRPSKLGEQAPVTPADDPERRVLSAKELARQRRHAMYERAKERRANDPRHLALKEAAKEQRRAAYQKLKAQRKAAAATAKAKDRIGRIEAHGEERAATDGELTKLLLWLARGSTAQN